MSVKNIESLCAQSLGNGKKLIESKITNLVPEGENYGGELLKLDLIVQNEKTSESEEVHVVVKKIPPTEMYQKVFNISHTFRAEINFYEKLVPLFQNFQRENKMEDVLDCFAKIYGSRLNLNGTDQIDEDAAMVFENLNAAGFRNIDRHTGFNLEETQLLFKYLAVLHAIPLAIKNKNPELFHQEVRPHMNNSLDKYCEFRLALPIFEAVLKESDACVEAVPKVQRVWNKFYYEDTKYEAKEPFATFVHGDLWVNNIMIKYAETKPTDIRFVDFQVYDYESPVTDILYFIFTSVQNEVLKEDLDNLLVYYHSHLTETLKTLGCDVEPFGYDSFLKEFEDNAYMTLVWVLAFNLFVVFGPKGDSSEPSLQDIIDYENKSNFKDILRRIPKIVKEKIQIIVEYSSRNHWI